MARAAPASGLPPSSIEDGIASTRASTDELNSTLNLARATGWKRSLHIVACVNAAGDDGKLTPREFAKRVGVMGVITIRRNLRTWDEAAARKEVPPASKIHCGGPAVKLPTYTTRDAPDRSEVGKVKPFPDILWKEHPRAAAIEEAARRVGATAGGTAGVARASEVAIHAAVLADPKVAKAALEGLAEIARRDGRRGIDVLGVIDQAYREGHQDRDAMRKEHTPDTLANDASDLLGGAVGLLAEGRLFAGMAEALRRKTTEVSSEPFDNERRLDLLSMITPVREALGDLIQAVEAGEVATFGADYQPQGD